MERFWKLIERQQRLARADLIEAVAAGFNAKNLPELLRKLRSDKD